jgi:F-type H+-transporting ATPase subunit epsilon
VLTVRGGRGVCIATREAITGDDLATLDETILARFHEDAESEHAEPFDSMRLQLTAIRQIVRQLCPAGARCAA